MSNRTKLKNEDFKATVNRVRATFTKDLKNGKVSDAQHSFCRWEWEIYDLVKKQWLLKNELLELERKVKDLIEYGDDF